MGGPKKLNSEHCTHNERDEIKQTEEKKYFASVYVAHNYTHGKKNHSYWHKSNAAHAVSDIPSIILLIKINITKKL